MKQSPKKHRIIKVLQSAGALVSSLATADALAKLLINKGLITQAEFTKQLSTDRAVYQAMFKKVK